MSDIGSVVGRPCIQYLISPEAFTTMENATRPQMDTTCRAREKLSVRLAKFTGRSPSE